MEGAYPRIYPGLASPDCVLDMLFDEGSGQTVVDATQHANHGAMTNMQENDWVVGHDGRGFALDYDSVNDFVRTPVSTVVNLTVLTACIRFYANAEVGGVREALGGVGDKNFELFRWGTLLKFRTDAGGGAGGALDTANPGDGIWYNYVGSYNGTSTVYLDGAQKAQAVKTQTVGATQITIGDNLSRWNGKLTDARLYNRVLSPVEVLRNYEQPRVRYDAPLMIGHMGLAA